MEQMRQLPDAVGEARRRPGVVRVAVDGHRRARQPEVRRARSGLPDVEAARPDDHELRLERERLGPARRAGRLPGAAEDVRRRRRARSSRGANARHRTAGRSTRRRRCAAAAGPRRRPPPARSCRASASASSRAALGDAETRSESPNGVGHVVQRARIERQDLRADRAGRFELAARDRADRAQVLRHDQVRAQRIDQAGVDHVQRAAVSDRRANRLVDLEARQARRVDPRRGHDRLPDDPARPATLLGDTHERVDQTEIGDHLRCTGKERTDAHCDSTLDRRDGCNAEPLRDVRLRARRPKPPRPALPPLPERRDRRQVPAAADAGLRRSGARARGGGQELGTRRRNQTL